MMIEIIGYVTKSHGGSSFTLKITNDNVEDESGNHPEVSKEAKIFITALYPNDYSGGFEETEEKYKREKREECCSRSKELKQGDRVKCSVFIVDTHIYNEETTYVINTNPNDIETYTKFELWMDPDPKSFERLEIDTPETLKFRRQNYYADINKKKCEKITGNSYKYRRKWWINNNPKITFPILWWIQVKTTASNLWKRLTRQENLPKSLLIANIVLAFITAISVAVAIWSLFFRNS